jgi:hypothetical protein
MAAVRVRIADPAYQWAALEPWILDWEVSADPDAVVLGKWEVGLAESATRIDTGVVWCPRRGVVIAPTEYSDRRVTDLLRQSTAAFAGIDES